MSDDRTYEDKVIRLTELVDGPVERPKVEGFTFIGCQINGPAVVLVVGGVTFTGCHFAGTPDALTWDFPEGSTKVGIIGLINCTFENCRITGIGVAGDRKAMAAFRRGIS